MQRVSEREADGDVATIVLQLELVEVVFVVDERGEVRGLLLGKDIAGTQVIDLREGFNLGTFGQLVRKVEGVLCVVAVVI